MRMSEYEKRQRRQERKAADERTRLVHDACLDERARMNQAVMGGKVVIVKAIGDRYVLSTVTPEWWYRTHPEGARPNEMNLRSWAGCNDGDWADMMEQAGLERNPLFAKQDRSIIRDYSKLSDNELSVLVEKGYELAIAERRRRSGSELDKLVLEGEALAAIAEEKSKPAKDENGNLQWVVRCMECNRELDRMANGNLATGLALLHHLETGHSVIVGNIYESAPAEEKPAGAAQLQCTLPWQGQANCSKAAGDGHCQAEEGFPCRIRNAVWMPDLSSVHETVARNKKVGETNHLRRSS